MKFYAPALLLSLAGCGVLATTPHTGSEANRPSLKAARGALAEGEAETALAIARGVLASEPKNAAALVAAGDANNALNNRIEAAKYYRMATAAQPGYVPAQIGVAKMKLRDDVKGAETDFRGILSNNPKDTAALTDLGVALDLQERHQEAQALYSKALDINPDLSAARVNLALSLALSGEPQKAETMLRDATEAGPVSPRVRADFAVAQLMAGHPDQAQATLQADLSADEAKASLEALTSLMPAGAKKN